MLVAQRDKLQPETVCKGDVDVGTVVAIDRLDIRGSDKSEMPYSIRYHTRRLNLPSRILVKVAPSVCSKWEGLAGAPDLSSTVQ